MDKHQRRIDLKTDEIGKRGNTIDDYIAGQPPEVWPLLQAIRETIHVAAPEALEKISWQMPTFAWLRRRSA